MKFESIKIGAKPCPFCGNDELRMKHSWLEFDERKECHTFAVVCPVCGASSGSSERLEGAMELWEKRVEPFCRKNDYSDAFMRFFEDCYTEAKHDQD